MYGRLKMVERSRPLDQVSEGDEGGSARKKVDSKRKQSPAREQCTIIGALKKEVERRRGEAEGGPSMLKPSSARTVLEGDDDGAATVPAEAHTAVTPKPPPSPSVPEEKPKAHCISQCRYRSAKEAEGVEESDEEDEYRGESKKGDKKDESREEEEGATTHLGPVAIYLGHVPGGQTAASWTGSGANWVKIAEWGAQFNPFKFIPDNPSQLTAQIPSGTPAGEIRVTGGGGGSPTKVSVPGYVSRTGPGLTVNIHYPPAYRVHCHWTSPMEGMNLST
ncbi:hypothetical protein BKA70DRAFT_1241473 [Coprinopsis sp. MPI-PUGE-AT-0042]|nr:hypothetical protein BKA70DRAFT_1241473 [Coprinopsis sp. MPI-PUGE-AT-0042]